MKIQLRHYVCLGKVANNITACYSVAKLTLIIATNIPPAYNIAPKLFAMTS
jgi:hypothetical protein